MGIKIKCSDGMIEIGGDFQGALALVKSIDGRQYDPATKIWTVPVSIHRFDSLKIGRPVNVLSGDERGRFRSGDHHTRYGNVYSRDEWAATTEANQAEGEVGRQFEGREAEIEAKYRQQLAGLGIDEQMAGTILSWRFEDLVESGQIKFSSPEREQAIWAIRNAHADEMMEVWRAEDDAKEAARERIWGKYGLE